MSTSRLAGRGRKSSIGKGVTSFPTQQLFVLALCRICEPIAFMSIFPYIYYMISSFHITTDDTQIAIYAGMVTSAFAFAEFSTGVIWGRLSDKIGRKPVLIGGLAGTGLSMIIFGFATNLPLALAGRALGGLLNGNIGVLQTTVAEMVTEKEHQPRAYAIMPFVWCLGSILGPALGGALAEPCISYPKVFGPNTIFAKFPYLLPNLVCAVILACGVLVGILFLEETHEDMKNRRDVGLEAGRWILSFFKRRQAEVRAFDKAADAYLDECRPLVEDELPPGYRSTEGTPHFPLSRAESPEGGPSNRPNRVAKQIGMRKAFTKQVILNIIGYGILAYHTIAFEQLMPVFLSTPISEEPPSLPFKFTGGFALPTKSIGLILSLQGVYSMTAQIFLFPVVVRKFGSLRTFRFVIMTWPVLYVLVPYLVLLPSRFQMVGVFICLLWKITAQVLAYPANAILLANSAPSMLVLGAINGIAASTASLSRAFGPTVSGIIYSWGLKMGYTGLAWWANALICVVGAIESLWMEETDGSADSAQVMDEEARLNDPCFDPVIIDGVIGPLGPSSEIHADFLYCELDHGHAED